MKIFRTCIYLLGTIAFLASCNADKEDFVECSLLGKYHNLEDENSEEIEIGSQYCEVFYLKTFYGLSEMNMLSHVEFEIPYFEKWGTGYTIEGHLIGDNLKAIYKQYDPASPEEILNTIEVTYVKQNN